MKLFLLCFLSFFSVLVSIAQVDDLPENISADGLVAWWPFNSNADDQTNFGHHAAVYGATLTTDRFNHKKSAFSFDGIGDYLSVEVFDESLMLSDNFTISLWLNIAFNFRDQYIFSKGDAYYPEFSLICRKSGELVFTSQGAMAQNNLTSFVGYNSWTNITCVVENGSVRVYSNGNWMGTTILSMPILPSTLPLTFGAQFQGGTVTPVLSTCFSGKLDDIAIWNRPLSQEEIEKLSK